MEKLSQVLAQEDTVLFIGSGISLWSGLPSWYGMIEELAKFIESIGAKADLVRAEAQRGDLLQAASYGFDKLTKQQIGDFIRTACRYGIAKPHDIHRMIVSLGPRCFVTTNYDNLLEESLRKWQPDRFFRPPITNRQLTETAEIVHARAIDFIFKPHGDAADSDSIILTREQYRQLLPQGERQNALETVKMLLASRPIVYLGFGLRDPDFIYVRDLLANTYKGGTRDHYAIMADVTDAESDYWRRNYGIHLIGYATTERPDGSRDHAGLLKLLNRLLESPSPVSTSAPVQSEYQPCSPDLILSLARHAARLARSPKSDPEFQIRVHAEAENDRRSALWFRCDKFDHCPIEEFLDAGPERALLIGLPGAGKTYSLHRAAARLSDKLHEACLSERFDEKSVIVPILADLKMYRGDLVELISQTLPKSLSFDEMSRRFKLKIFLDSFNEMPREYWETGSYESDFAKFTASISNSSIIIGSRTKDGLLKLGLPTYSLDQIDEKDVEAEFQRLGVEISGRFDDEILSLLQKPFYFQLVASGRVSLPKEAHPRDFYRAFFDNLRNSFEARFGNPFDIDKALSLSSYDAINRGEEAYPLSDLLRTLKTSLESAGLAKIDVRDIANWLVSTLVLIPHTGGRVAFVHQSVTEYLAASELARRYQMSPHILKEKLSLTRWDQALFLALSLLPPSQADTFLKSVIEADFVLALNAARYLEEGRDQVVSKLLAEIPERVKGLSDLKFQIEEAVRSSLPISEAHEPQLRMLMKSGGIIGGAAVSRLLKLKGGTIKDEMLPLLLESCDDYGYCLRIGEALKPFATNDDIRKMAAWADSLQEKVTSDSYPDNIGGFTTGASHFLAGLDLTEISQELFPKAGSGEVPNLRTKILCDILQEQHSTASLDLAAELLLRGVDDAATCISFIANFGEPDCDLSWSSFNINHVDRLESLIFSSNESWGIYALKELCAARSDLADLVKRRALKKSCIAKAVLLYCASAIEISPVFDAISELAAMNEEERRQEPTHVLKGIDINWAGKEDLFIQLLRLRDTQLALNLFGPIMPYSNPSLGSLEIGPIEWWLEWMMEQDHDLSREWLSGQLGGVFAGHLKDEARDAFVTEFNKSGSKFRRLLLDYILPYRSDLTTEAFSEDTISFLLADLSQDRQRPTSFLGYLLGITATEQFVTERLLPLLPDAKSPFLENLQNVLREAGSRHGRRYVSG